MRSGKDSSSSQILSEDELRALRGSKFAPLPAPPPPARAKQPRLAHPGGPMKTNKAAALAKFLERKLQQPGGLDSLDPDLVEVAVKSAKETMFAGKGGPSNFSRIVHVASFDDSEEFDQDQEKPKEKKQKRKDSGQNEDKRKEEKWKKKKNKKKKVGKKPIHYDV